MDMMPPTSTPEKAPDADQMKKAIMDAARELKAAADQYGVDLSSVFMEKPMSREKTVPPPPTSMP